MKISTCFIVMGFLSVGCGSQEVRDDSEKDRYLEQSSAVFAPEPSSDSSELSDDELVKAQGGWTIMLSNITEGGMESAKRLLYIIQNEGGLKDAFIESRSTGIMVAYGDYLGKDDQDAIKDLKKIQTMEIQGVNVFGNATMVPPSGDDLRGTNANHDLRTVKQRYGESAMYTLQIGVYGRSDYQMPNGKDLLALRSAAEQAVRDLRNEGVMAFYYHAPARSMVTVGVFGERDYDPTTLPALESTMLREMRKRFPNNLLNGQGIQESVRTEIGKTKRIQASQLVAIPKR